MLRTTDDGLIRSLLADLEGLIAFADQAGDFVLAATLDTARVQLVARHLSVTERLDLDG